MNVKRKRELNDTIDNINLFPKQNDMVYESFISDNNLILSEIIVPQKTISDEKINKELKEKFDVFLKMKNLYFSNESMKINNKVNLINKAYSFNDIKFFSRKAITEIDEYLKCLNNFQSNTFKFKKGKETIDILSNKNFKKGTFIADVIGFYCFRKTKTYQYENINGFKEIFLYMCHDKK